MVCYSGLNIIIFFFSPRKRFLDLSCLKTRSGIRVYIIGAYIIIIVWKRLTGRGIKKLLARRSFRGLTINQSSNDIFAKIRCQKNVVYYIIIYSALY